MPAAGSTGPVVLPNNGWTRVAREGNVTLSTQDFEISFGVTTADADPVPGVAGHPLPRGNSYSLLLSAGEYLSVRGKAGQLIELTADDPVILT